MRTKRRGIGRHLAGAAVTCLLLSACIPAAVAAPTARNSAVPTTAGPDVGGPNSRAGKPLMAVGLGDSALTNQNCGCSDLLVDYGLLAGRRIGSDVVVRNEAQSGSTSDDLRQTLKNQKVRSEISSADVVVIFTGANDFFPAFGKVSGGASAARTYGPVAETVRHNVEWVVGQVRRNNSHARIVVCGYWNDFKDGSVARHQYSAAQRRAAASATQYTNRALSQAADGVDVHYVSTRKLFKARADVTPLLASDGDHLSAAGHRMVAQALVDLLHPNSPSRDRVLAASAAPAQAQPAQAQPAQVQPAQVQSGQGRQSEQPPQAQPGAPGQPPAQPKPASPLAPPPLKPGSHREH